MMPMPHPSHPELIAFAIILIGLFILLLTHADQLGGDYDPAHLAPETRWPH